MRHAVTLAAALILAPLHAAGIELSRPIRIETGLLEGVPDVRNEVVAFRGIPYAAPPVGNLRWREPQPLASWKGIRKADRFGAACVQPRSPNGKQPAEMSEDCLFLNVWAPVSSTNDKRAVLFFIHGGAGQFGSGNLNGAELARKGIIVVTVNYRLGIFAGMGHPDLTAESPHHTCGMYGMLDLIAALRWVQKNIGAFGGDASRVTIAGHSSGACAVHYLTTSPLAKGLFRGAIAVSFPYDYLMKPNMIPFVRQKEEDGVAFVKLTQAKSLTDLRRVPALTLIAPGYAMAQAKLIHLRSGVVRDGWAIPAAYPDALDQGLANDVPTLTGMTADDFGPPAKYMTTTVATFATTLPGMFGEKRLAFLAKQDSFLALCPVNTDQETRAMAKLVQTEYRLVSILQWTMRRAKTARTSVYTYFFDHAASERGAYHGSDLAYEFNDCENRERVWTDNDRRVADEVSSYWVNFIRTGNPNGENLPRWSPVDVNNPSTMVLGLKSGPRPIASKERLAFYRELFEQK